MHTLASVRSVIIFFTTGALLVLPLLLGADDTTFTNPVDADNLYDFLLLILNALIYILFPILILMIIYSGFLFVAAQGNEQKLTEAKRAVVWTIIGGIILLGAKALALAVQATVESIS